MDYKYSSVTNIGLKRLGNEDSLGVYEIENGILAIVSDGLGGNKAGDVASQLSVHTVYEFFKSSNQKDYLGRIKSAILEANNSILQKASASIDFKGMATTIEVLFLLENTAYFGHVGDSRMYFLRNGKLKQITKDHSLVQKLIDEGFLTVDEAEHHPNRNIIMRALGDNFAIEIDLSKITLNSYDDCLFFLCTDGVTTVVKDNELEEILTNYDNIRETLSDLINQRGAPDNFTFVCITKK
jgi:serine/threonine protein phosphatase PrpC